MKKIIIPGGSGFLGMELAQHFSSCGYNVIILSRSPKSAIGNISFVPWDGRTFAGWETSFEEAEAVINLTGRSVDCRYNQKNKDLILNSRLDATRIVGAAIRQCKNPPKVWINAGSATIYEHSLEKGNDETTGKIGTGFSVDVCKAWEKTFEEENCPDTRKLFLRISIVLGKTGGAFVPIRQLATFGLGGKQGNGEQMISWIHIHDFIRSIEWLIQYEDKSGIYNIVSPNPVRNAVFMEKLRQKVGIPLGLPMPKFLLKIGAVFIRTETELILKSRFVLSRRLGEEGFVFEFPGVGAAFGDLLS